MAFFNAQCPENSYFLLFWLEFLKLLPYGFFSFRLSAIVVFLLATLSDCGCTKTLASIIQRAKNIFTFTELMYDK